MNPQLELMAYATVHNLAAAGLTLTTAESCTGGLIAAAITSVPGASAVFRYGWVVYCKEAKIQQLGVSPELITKHTVVSEPVVAAMAEGACNHSRADIAIAVSGNAGPDAAADEPPVGTVCLAILQPNTQSALYTETIYRPGMIRQDFRTMVALRALELVSRLAGNHTGLSS